MEPRRAALLLLRCTSRDRQGDLMMVVDVVLGRAFSAGKSRQLFEGRFDVGVIGNPDYDVTADGQRFLMLRRSD